MSFDLGTAVGRIVLDYDGSGVDDANKDQTELQKNSGGTAKALGTVSTAAGVAGLAIAGGLAVAVNTAASFEQRMSAISAVSGATGSELDSLRDKALQLGKDTSFSASESASAMEELVKAGLTTEDVLNGAADATVALAAAGGVALPEAATIASNAMNQFGLAAKDLPGVADQIAGAANASAIDVSDLGQSLTQVGAVANLAGVSFEDTATAIALMGNAGIKGSDAGTSLKSMFARLQPTTTKTTDLFRELGLTTTNLEGANKALASQGLKTAGSYGEAESRLSTYVAGLGRGAEGTKKNAAAVDDLMASYGGLHNQFYTQKGDLKDLSKVSGILQKSMKGMTREQKQATLQTLFGSDAIRAAAILSKNGAKGFDDMAQSIGKVKAADVAKKRLDNFNGSMEQMKGSLETAGIAVGTALIPMLRTLVDAITGVANWFNNLSDSTKSWVAGSAAALAALLLIVAGVVKFILFAQKMYQALVVLRTAMAATWIAALGPIALIIAAIALVVAIIILLWKKNETFRKVVLAVWSAIKAAALAVASWFAGPFVDFFVKAWGMIVGAFQAALSFIKNNWKTLLLIFLLGPLGIVIALIIKFKSQILNVFRAIMNGVKSIIKTIWNTIKSIFKTYMNVIKTIVKTYLNSYKAIFKAVWGAIKAIVSTYINAVKAVVTNGVRLIKSVITSAWNAVKSATKAAWGVWVTIVKGAIEKVIGAVRGIQGAVTGALANAGTWLYEKGKAIIQGLINGIASMAGALKDKAKSVIGDGISKIIPGSPVKEGPLRKLNHGKAGRQIVQMLVDGISGAGPDLRVALDSVGLATTPSGVSPVRVAGGGVRKGTRSGTATSRIVSGSLAIDPSGRAYLTGVAEDVYDRFQEDNDRRDRMG